ncbi:protein kinase, putative, partial [Bodo saltans]
MSSLAVLFDRSSLFDSSSSLLSPKKAKYTMKSSHGHTDDLAGSSNGRRSSASLQEATARVYYTSSTTATTAVVGNHPQLLLPIKDSSKLSVNEENSRNGWASSAPPNDATMRKETAAEDKATVRTINTLADAKLQELVACLEHCAFILSSFDAPDQQHHGTTANSPEIIAQDPLHGPQQRSSRQLSQVHPQSTTVPDPNEATKKPTVAVPAPLDTAALQTLEEGSPPVVPSLSSLMAMHHHRHNDNANGGGGEHSFHFEQLHARRSSSPWTVRSNSITSSRRPSHVVAYTSSAQQHRRGSKGGEIDHGGGAAATTPPSQPISPTVAANEEKTPEEVAPPQLARWVESPTEGTGEASAIGAQLLRCAFSGGDDVDDSTDKTAHLIIPLPPFIDENDGGGQKQEQRARQHNKNNEVKTAPMEKRVSAPLDPPGTHLEEITRLVSVAKYLVTLELQHYLCPITADTTESSSHNKSTTSPQRLNSSPSETFNLTLFTSGGGDSSPLYVKPSSQHGGGGGGFTATPPLEESSTIQFSRQLLSQPQTTTQQQQQAAATSSLKTSMSSLTSAPLPPHQRTNQQQPQQLLQVNPMVALGGASGVGPGARSPNMFLFTPLPSSFRPSSTTQELSSDIQSVRHIIQQVTTTTLTKTKDEFTGNKTINQYVVLDDIGEGACGKVKLAYSLERNITVAIKIVRRAIGRKVSSSDGRALGRRETLKEDTLRREISLMKRLRHPNLVSLFEVIDDPNAKKMYLVMRFADKGSVGAMREDLTCDAMPLRALVDMAFQVCCGL